MIPAAEERLEDLARLLATPHARQRVHSPEGATYGFVTPLLMVPGPANPCDSVVEVRATIDESPNLAYAVGLTVIVSDRALARRSQEAYQALLSTNATAKQKQELEKAKQQKAPDL